MDQAALLVPPFFDLFDDLGAEGFKITGIARSDDALVDDDLSVLPGLAPAFATSVLIDL